MKKLHLGLVVGIAIGLIAGLAIGYAVSVHSQPKTGQNPPTIGQLLSLVNAERAKYHVAPLKEDARLDASAQFKATDEVQRHYFGHEDPTTGKNNGLDFANTTGIKCKWVSENLHWADLNILTAKETVDGWISSPAHHAAMIDPKYSLTGFGINGTQVVEHFCEQ